MAVSVLDGLLEQCERWITDVDAVSFRVRVGMDGRSVRVKGQPIRADSVETGAQLADVLRVAIGRAGYPHEFSHLVVDAVGKNGRAIAGERYTDECERDRGDDDDDDNDVPELSDSLMAALSPESRVTLLYARELRATLKSQAAAQLRMMNGNTHAMATVTTALAQVSRSNAELRRDTPRDEGAGLDVLSLLARLDGDDGDDGDDGGRNMATMTKILDLFLSRKSAGLGVADLVDAVKAGRVKVDEDAVLALMDAAPSQMADVLTSDRVKARFLKHLETLPPAERAAFLARMQGGR